jgi:hypothetical protein
MGGNAIFLLEIPRSLDESAGLPNDLTGLESFPLTDSVREAVEAWLRRLGPVTRRVLEAGATLGRPFDFGLAHLTAGRGEMETVDGLDAPVARQLLVRQATGYRF